MASPLIRAYNPILNSVVACVRTTPESTPNHACKLNPFKIQQFHPTEETHLRNAYAPIYSSICSHPCHPMVRILAILPSQDRTAPLHCKLAGFPLDECPSYIALSYVWGPEQPARWIEVNGEKFGVRPNLYNALLQLRNPEYPEYFWADAICIDQYDTDERNSQVRLMRQVYKRADMTVIYLGEGEGADRSATPGFEMAHEFLCINNKMFAAQDHRTISEMSGEDYLKYNIPNPRVENPAVTSYLSLLKRQWFKRVWILQEVAVSDKLMICYGRHAIPWEEFIASAKVAEALGFQALTRGSPRFMFVDTARGLYRDGAMQRLLPLLARYRSTQASDPRDKVNALLGLLNEPPLELQPNYGLDEASTYQQTALFILKESQNLDLLSIPRPIGGRQTTGLPSWVPDWANEDPSLPLTYHLWREEQNRSQAARKRQDCMILDSDGKVLVVFGHVIDQITSLGEMMKWDSESDNPNISIYDCIDSLQREQQIYFSWKSIAISEPDVRWSHRWSFVATPEPRAKYPSTGEDSQDVFWQVLVAGQIGNGYDTVKQEFKYFDEAMAVYTEPRVLTRRVHLFRGFKSRMGVCMNRRILRTKSGYVGLGPGLAREGDTLFLLKGACLPILLRPTGNNWELIGDAYIHGINVTGKLDETKCERLQLI